MTLVTGRALVYLLALTPAVFWGVSSVLSKRGFAAGGTTLQATLVVVGIDAALYWLVLLARQGPRAFAGLTPVAAATFLAAGALGTALGRLSVFAGIDRVGASVNSAVISTRPLFAALLAAGFLGESITPSIAVGIAVLVAGLAVLALARGGDIEGWHASELLFPLAAAGCFAVGNVLRRFGLGVAETTVFEAVTINASAAVVVLVAYVLVVGDNQVRSASRESYRYFAASAVFTAISILALFTALSLPDGRVAVVDALAATSPLFTAAFSALFLRDLERVTRGVVVGAVVVVLGVVVITSGGALLG
ncbi:EamA family transporter [Halosimplex sp. J119]